MAETIAGVVEKPADAQKVIDELVNECLCDRADISVMVRDAGGGVTGTAAHGASAIRDAVQRSATAATTLINELYGGAETLSRSFPGGGALRVVGKLAATVANAGIVSAAEVMKALIDAGVPKADARFYGEAVEKGGMVVTVHAKTENVAACARKVMMKYGAAMPEDRAAA